ncbi:MAG: hypothetical protein ABS58_16430 [Mesorhizobium sp. SCN 65-20]|nr:MAG: hypothetical protein ABS58_16430 [Mesorhizobium sp. SCN 65-20]
MDGDYGDWPEKSWHPTFKVKQFVRNGETDSQWEAVLRDQRHHAKVKGLYLGLFQLLAGHLGFHRKCPLPACRRQRKCTGRRAEDDWSFAFKPMIPPCVPLEEGIVEAMRAEIRAEVRRIVAAADARDAAASCQRPPEG